MEANTIFGKLSDLEKEMFQPTIDILMLLKEGILVFDDELLASRAKDVEKKTLSQRKTGKEGPVSDCVADSADGKLFGMKLRESGKSEHQNMMDLLDRLPKLTHAGQQRTVHTHFDRGYGKLALIIILLTRGFTILTVASTLGSRHPFITQEEVNSKIAAWHNKGKDAR